MKTFTVPIDNPIVAAIRALTVLRLTLASYIDGTIHR